MVRLCLRSKQTRESGGPLLLYSAARYIRHSLTQFQVAFNCASIRDCSLKFSESMGKSLPEDVITQDYLERCQQTENPTLMGKSRHFNDVFQQDLGICDQELMGPPTSAKIAVTVLESTYSYIKIYIYIYTYMYTCMYACLLR